MRQTPAKGRAIFTQEMNKLTIEIPSKRNWFIILFMTLWMGGWALGMRFALDMLFNFELALPFLAFVSIWLIGWTVAGSYIVTMILWQLAGLETIKIQKGILTIGKSIKGVGRKREFDISAIQHIDLHSIEEVSRWSNSYSWRTFRKNNGKIKFDYGMKTIKFASDIDEAEGRMIIEKLKSNSNFTEENFAQN